MRARRGHAPRCPRCRMLRGERDLCLCGVLPVIETETRVVVVSHAFELTRTTNTARLAALMLPQLDLRARGAPAPRPWPPVPGSLATAGRRVRLLYPDPAAPALTAAEAHQDPCPITLVLPDGSWPQARRAARREPALASLDRWRLPDGPPSRFRLRDPRRTDQHLCTLEAIARGLGIIEGHHVEARLLAGLDAFVHRVLASRGRLRGAQAIDDPPSDPLADAAG